MYLSNISLIFVGKKRCLFACLPACPCACGLIYFSPLPSKSVGNKYMLLIMNVFYEQSTKIDRLFANYALLRMQFKAGFI